MASAAAAASGRKDAAEHASEACVRQRRMEVAWTVDEFGSKDENVQSREKVLVSGCEKLLPALA